MAIGEEKRKQTKAMASMMAFGEERRGVIMAWLCRRGASASGK